MFEELCMELWMSPVNTEHILVHACVNSTGTTELSSAVVSGKV